VIEFTVLGHAQPAGSKRAFAARRGGVPTGRVVVVDDNKRAKPWQELVSSAAAAAVDGARLEGPLLLEVDFYVARPAGHFGRGRNADVVRASAPAFPAVRPDVTKLVRGVEDAMTGIVWRDDAQVVTQTARKRYGWPERAEVVVQTIDEFLPLGGDLVAELVEPEPLDRLFDETPEGEAA
jgi:Holliday junction resolvase RusA-like endonuclease